MQHVNFFILKMKTQYHQEWVVDNSGNEFTEKNDPENPYICILG